MVNHQSSVSGRRLPVVRTRLWPSLAVFVFCAFLCCAQDKPAAVIPPSEITALKADFAEGVKGTSSVDVRRACKSVIRNAQALLASIPDAPNRYDVLAIIFEGQKRLLSLEFTEGNRDAIFETCRGLRDAPDEYAELRLEADMLLSERELAEKQATVDERIKELKSMLANYRGTPAEWKSLMMGSLIAGKLYEFDFEDAITTTMIERFSGDHKAIAFRRESKAGGEIEAVFSGTYETEDGASLTFPYDRMGHQYIVSFWSEATPDIQVHLAALRDIQVKHPGRFEVYSLNVDGLPDAGVKLLRQAGLDCTALRLPGGRKSSAYRAYADCDPCAVLVNGQGHVLLVLPPKAGGGALSAGMREGFSGGWGVSELEKTLDDNRYLAQLRSLFIGDFLVASQGPQAAGFRLGTETASDLRAVQECFISPPLRYRMTQKEELSGYEKAERLCATAIRKYANEQEVWAFRNHRIIAFLGMWNLAREPRHLQEAVKEAETVLAMDLPVGADVAARFCLAKAAFRNGHVDPESRIAELVKDAGGGGAIPAVHLVKEPMQVPASALAVASILALEANAATVHAMYRKQLLDVKDNTDSSLWPVRSFLRDLHHCYRNFRAAPGGIGYGKPQKYKFRDTVAGLDSPGGRARRLGFDLKNVSGRMLKVPEVASGEMLGVVFAEPPSDGTALSNLVSKVNVFGQVYVRKGVKVVVALLSEDTNTVDLIAGQIDPEFEVGLLPEGLASPVVSELGILSADRVPNPLLYRPDGTVAWFISGLDYRQYSDGPEHAISLAIASNIEKVGSDEAFEALDRGEYKKALELFAERLPPQSGKDWWTSDRLQGRALAHMGLKDWQAALTEIDAAIEQRRDNFKSAMCKCHGVVEMHLTKADILEMLGRDHEAKMDVRRAENERLPHSRLPPGDARGGVPVGVYYDVLKEIRLSLKGRE